MGTKITALPRVVTPVGTDELPISQDTGLGSRITYKATLDQVKTFLGSSGSVTNVNINSTDGSIDVFGSPITNGGTITVNISSVKLDKLDDGGAIGGDILTFNQYTSTWGAGRIPSSGLVPNILVGNGTTTYTLLNYTNDTTSNYLVFVGGVAQRPTTDFSISGDSIIFGSIIRTGVQILVYSLMNIISFSIDTTPIGTVSWFTASAAPIGYLECDGRIVSKIEYPDLWTIVSDTFSAVALSADHFRLPDLRGEFVRGWSHGKTGVDTSRTFGSNQKGTIVGYDLGDNAIYTLTTTTEDGPESQVVMGVDDYNISDYTGVKLQKVQESDGENIKGSNNISYTGITRPRNVALLPCIKSLKTFNGDPSTLNFIENPPSPTNGQVLTYNGSTSTWVASAAPTGGNIISGTATTLNTLSTFDFTGIPSWVKRITIMVSEMSTNGIYSPRLQVGTSAGFITTGYRGTKLGIIDASTATTWLTDGFAFNDNDFVDAMPHNGSGTLTKLSDTIWCYSGVYGLDAYQTRVGLCGGAVTITGTLDRIRFLTSSPTGTFDGGTVNIMWE